MLSGLSNIIAAVLLAAVAVSANGTVQEVGSRAHLTTGNVEVSVAYNSILPIVFDTASLVTPGTKSVVHVETATTRSGALIGTVVCITPDTTSPITNDMVLACYAGKAPFDSAHVRSKSLFASGVSNNYLDVDANTPARFVAVVLGQGAILGDDGSTILENTFKMNVDIRPIGPALAKALAISRSALRGNTGPTPSIATLSGLQAPLYLSVTYSTEEQTDVAEQNDALITELDFSGGIDPSNAAMDFIGVIINQNFVTPEFTITLHLNKADASANTNVITTCSGSGTAPLPRMTCNINLDPATPSVWARITMTSDTVHQYVNLTATMKPLQ